MGVIILDNKSSKNYGIVVEIEPNYEIAERAYDVTTVPGRGDVLIDLKYYRNVPRQYQIAVAEEGGSFSSLAPKIAEWLSVKPGYVRLEDSYNKNQYVLARIEGTVDVLNVLKQAGRATLTFNRCPKRYLYSGEERNVFTSANSGLFNPTQNESHPLITIYTSGNSSFSINGSTVSITGVVGTITFDCETKDAFLGTTKINNNVIIQNDSPVLQPGQNSISFSSTVKQMDVIPRWWVL